MKTKLGGGSFSEQTVRDHYCRIASASIADCVFWSEKYTGCKDLLSILDDEGIESDTDDDEPLQRSVDRGNAGKKRKRK